MVLPFKLKVVGGDLEASEVMLALPATLGRAPDLSLTLLHPLVSRHHCEIYQADDQIRVRDLGSLNGTFIGSQRIDDSPILPGELLTVGTVTFRAEFLPVDRPGVVGLPESAEEPHLTRPATPVARQRLMRPGQPSDAPHRRTVQQAETEPLRGDLSPLPQRNVLTPDVPSEVETQPEPS